MALKQFDFAHRDYRSMHETSVESQDYWDCSSYTTISILEFLNGKLWDEVALAYVLAMKPSVLRVTTDAVSLDGDTNRITIFVNEDNTIRQIRKEICIYLPNGIANGYEMEMRIRNI